MKHLGLERKEGVIKVMVVEVRLSLVEGGISRSGGVENGEREEKKKKPHCFSFLDAQVVWCPDLLSSFFSLLSQVKVIVN